MSQSLSPASNHSEEIVLRLPGHRLRARNYRDRIDQVSRRVGLAAVFAGIAVLVGRLAERAGATHEAVGQEHAFLLVVGLFDRLGVDVARRLQGLEHLDRESLVFR